jgi:hypothetical protein
MESEKAKDEASKQTPESIASELEAIRESVQKRKSDTTTLKILFYTGFAALLLGFFYTNQTLQRAQHRNLESHVTLLQSQVSHTLLMLEKKLHEEITDLDVKFSLHSGSNLSERIKNLNEALEQFKPQSTSMDILIEKVQRSSNELRQMVEAENLQEMPPVLEPKPFK